MKASGCIIAMNEGQYIERAILNLQQMSIVDEIVVVDGGSTDDTVAICERMGCRVVYNKWAQDFALQRNFAMSVCKNDWVIWLDADEWYSDKAARAISQILPAIPDKYGAIMTHEITEVDVPHLHALPFDVYSISKYIPEYEDPNFYRIGEPFAIKVNGSPIYTSYTYRVVNKTKGQWCNKIHETFELYPPHARYILPYEYVIHHQKSAAKQYASNAKYFGIDFPDSVVYRIDHDDFVDGLSPKSVTTLDEVFTKIVTEVAPCDWFIEAGAWQGDMSRSVQTALPNASVYAFEANPYNYEQFKSMFDGSQAKYINLAVSNTDGNVTFKVQRNYMGNDVDPVRGNNSMLRRTEEGMEYEDVTVRSTTLNGFFADKIEPNHKVAMWVDLEGVAYDALLGAAKILPYVNVIKVEVEQYQFWEGQKLDADIRALLAQYGFFPILRDYEYNNQYNIIFCRSEVLDSASFQSLADDYKLIPNTWYFNRGQ